MSQELQNKLTEAYSMLSNYKAGNLYKNKKYISLIELLVDDLLPGVIFNSEKAEELLLLVAREDTKWNKEAQEVITELYELKKQNDIEVSKRLISKFNSTCPSSWYKSIVTSI